MAGDQLNLSPSTRGGWRVTQREYVKRPVDLRAMKCRRFFFAERAEFTCAATNSRWRELGWIAAARVPGRFENENT